MMTTHRLEKFLSVCMLFGVLFLSGCANYLKPEIGAIARKDARIELDKKGVQDGLWTTNDLSLTYSYSQSGNTFDFSGVLSLDRSLTDSFPVVKRFSLKMNFLDGEGRVLDTVDITPMFSYSGVVSDHLKIQSISSFPAGTSFLAFNYFGIFKGGGGGGDERGGGDWDIFYFPFE